MARYLQDVATDDLSDAKIGEAVVWVVRRTTLQVTRWPEWDSEVHLVTWCGALGPCWVERRTTVSVEGRPLVEASSVWVSLDPVTLRLAMLDEEMFGAFASAANGAKVSSKLFHSEPPDTSQPDTRSHKRSWPLRMSDFDVLGHVNNASTWQAVEDEAARVGFPMTLHQQRLGPVVLQAEMEYRASVNSGQDVEIVSVTSLPVPLSVQNNNDKGVPSMQIWILADGHLTTTAELTLWSPEQSCALS